MESAASRVSFAFTYDAVVIIIDGKTEYIGKVDELAAILKAHKQMIDYIDAHDGDGNEI